MKIHYFRVEESRFKMEKSGTLLVTLFVVLILAASADVEVRRTSKNTGDSKNVETSNRSNSGNDKVTDTEAKGKNQVGGGSKEEIGASANELHKNDATRDLGGKDGGDNKKKADGSGSNEVGDKNGKMGEGSDSESTRGSVPPIKKDGSRGEECDSSSNSCTIKENALVACLRVPGNESPDLSLLIQNKAKETVTVSISAPSFVHLEKKQIQLLEKESNKVKVSIGKGGADSAIILRAGSGNCTLDFKDLIMQDSSKDTGPYSQFAYKSFLKSASSIWVVLFAAFLMTGCILVFVSFRLKHLARTSSRYEKLDMELPVSTNAKRETDLNDGWDNSWDDDWDDEEAPKTPSLPVTPSPPSKSIASRRMNKEWKD